MPKISELPTIPATDAKLVASDSGGDAGNVLASDFATSTQGSLAATAVQPDDLATVATTGDYSDLSGRPMLGDMAAKDDVDISDINATGTPSNLTFLRGDGQWVPGASGVATVTGDLVDNTDPANPAINNPTVADIDATGTADSTTFLRGDGQWATPSGMGLGDVTGPSSATNNNIAVFDGETGKLIADGGINSGTFATAAQGSLAATAVQPGDLATVATTGAYSDLSGTPTLGNSASLDVGTTSGTVAAGNDTRITGAQQASAKGQPNGYASLDGGGKVPEAQLPNLGGSSWEQIGSPVSVTAGASVSITSIPADYIDLFIEIDGVQHNDAGNTNITMDISVDNGSTWITGQAISASGPNTAPLTGSALYQGYSRGFGIISGRISTNLSDPAVAATNTNLNYGTRHTSPVNALRFRTGAGSPFKSGGTINLLGFK